MEFRPLLSALWRNRIGPLLVGLQVAVTLSVLANAAYVVKQRVDTISRPTGIDLEDTFTIVSVGFAPDYNHGTTVNADLQYLNTMPGVVAAAVTHNLPQGSGMSVLGFSTQPDDNAKSEFAALYLSSEKMVEALGLKLIAGRVPAAEVVAPPAATFNETIGRWAPQIVITQNLATKLFPKGDALGKTIHVGMIKRSSEIVGIVERMQAQPIVGPNSTTAEQVALVPIVPAGPIATYLVRAQPGRRDELMAKVEKEFEVLQPGRFISRIEALGEIASRTRAPARATAIILGVVTVMVLAITALGTFGLAAFNVATRTKQIGTRRALGACKYHIFRYFLLENWFVTSSGVVVGCVLALAVGIRLSVMLQTPRLPLYYLVGGIVGLWLIGLIAVLVPARRAAAISPAIATRTV